MITLLRLKYSSCKAAAFCKKSKRLPKNIKVGAKKAPKESLSLKWGMIFYRTMSMACLTLVPMGEPTTNWLMPFS
jgi:hypothetical protein